MLFLSKAPRGLLATYAFATLAAGAAYNLMLTLGQTDRAPLAYRDAMSIRLSAARAQANHDNEFTQVADYLRPFDPDEVGLRVPSGNSSHDYFWWVAFDKHASRRGPTFRYVRPNVWPESDDPPPEWLIVRRQPLPNATLQGVQYAKVFEAGSSQVYRRIDDKAD